MSLPPEFVEYEYRRLSSLIDEDEMVVASWKRLHVCHSKLKHATEITSIMSYFAVLGAVELNIHPDDASPALITAMVITTSLLVATTMYLKVVCCSLLPHIQSVIGVCEVSDVSRSPHDSMLTLIHTTWILACVVGPVLFVLDLILLSWIKFWIFAIEAAYAATGVLVGLLIAMALFGTAIYRNLGAKQNRTLKHGIHGRGHAFHESWDESSEELSSVSVESSCSGSFVSAKASLLTKPNKPNLYGAMDPSDPMLFFSFSHENNLGV